MEKTKVHNLIIVDASGSMQSIYNQALTGINETIKTIDMVHQKDLNVDQTLTLLSFADGGEKPQYVYKDTDIKNVCQVEEKDYQLRGMTALYDAIGESVTDLRRKVGVNDKALVTIITDGYENDSRIWNGTQIKQLIDELRTKGWVFTYIGANQDVEAEAKKMGVVNSMKFEATTQGTIEMFEREGRYRQRWNERVSRGEENLEEGYFMEEASENIPSKRITSNHIERLAPNEVFVFGSNIVGRHDGGAAKAALIRLGAQYGVGEGLQGHSYAIPTVGCHRRETAAAIQRFISVAKANANLKFLVTPIGCGNGGWQPTEMARLFAAAMGVENISLPRVFWQYLIYEGV